MAPLGYQRGLDGLRGVAVLAVLTYHSGLIAGGFLGVDVFFALSGFLITHLLLEEQAATGRIRLTQFYLRRALRLLPALVVLLAGWGVWLLFTVPAAFWPTVGWIIAAVLFYVGNWATLAGLPLGIFGHTWSLAIEEQFYACWPLLFLALGRLRCRRAVVVGGLVLGAAVSLGWRLYLAQAGGARAFLATEAHADGLLIGAALAVLLAQRPVGTPMSRVTAAVGAVGLFALLVFTPFVPSYVWGVTSLAALATAACIVDVLALNSVLAPLLGRPTLVGIGRISYALYLWHFPIFFQCGVLREPGQVVAAPERIALAWALSLAAAAGSYWLVERPLLAHKARFGWAPLDAARRAMPPASASRAAASTVTA